MVSAQELHDRYKEELVDNNLGNELIPTYYLKGLQGITEDEAVGSDGELDRELLQHIMTHVQNPLDRNHHWLVFGATVNVRQVEGSKEDAMEEYDQEAMRSDDPESSEMFMLTVVTQKEFVNYLYDSVTGELYEKIDRSQHEVDGKLAV